MDDNQEEIQQERYEPEFYGHPDDPASFLAFVALFLGILEFFIGWIAVAGFVILLSEEIGKKCWAEGCTRKTWVYAKLANRLAVICSALSVLVTICYVIYSSLAY